MDKPSGILLILSHFSQINVPWWNETLTCTNLPPPLPRDLCNTYVHELVHSMLLDHHWPTRHKSFLQNATPAHKFLLFYNRLWNTSNTTTSCHMYNGQSIRIVVALCKKLLLPDIWVNLIFQGENLILSLVKDTSTFKIKRFQYTDNTITNQPPKWTHFHSLLK